MTSHIEKVIQKVSIPKNEFINWINANSNARIPLESVLTVALSVETSGIELECKFEHRVLKDVKV